MADTLLKVDGINVYYGNIHAVKDISFTVNTGEIVTLIGANGAGKSTTLKTISGLLKPRTGDVLYKGKSIKGKREKQRINEIRIRSLKNRKKALDKPFFVWYYHLAPMGKLWAFSEISYRSAQSVCRYRDNLNQFWR